MHSRRSAVKGYLVALVLAACAGGGPAEARQAGDAVAPVITRKAATAESVGGYEMTLARSGERRWLGQQLVRFLGAHVTGDHPVVAGALSFLQQWGDQQGIPITATVSRAVNGQRTLVLQANRGLTTVVATLTHGVATADGRAELLRLRSYEVYNRPSGGMTNPSTEIHSSFYPALDAAAQQRVGLSGADVSHGVFSLVRQRPQPIAGDWRMDIVHESAFWSSAGGFLQDWAPVRF